MINKLRLLITDVCYRNCHGCCNKQYDLASLPICNDYTPYDEVLITGGEPMLVLEQLMNVLHDIKQTDAKAILYTAMPSPTLALLLELYLDGITITLHEHEDMHRVRAFEKFILRYDVDTIDKTLRLNIFEGANIHASDFKPWWGVKSNIVWQDPCPLPEGEVFMRTANAITLGEEQCHK